MDKEIREREMNNPEIRGLESVHRIKAIESTYEVRAVKQDIVYQLKINILKLIFIQNGKIRQLWKLN